MKHIHDKNYLKNINVNKMFAVNIIFMMNDLFTKHIYDKTILNIFLN